MPAADAASLHLGRGSVQETFPVQAAASVMAGTTLKRDDLRQQ